MTRYPIKPRKIIYVKGYAFLSFAKNSSRKCEIFIGYHYKNRKRYRKKLLSKTIVLLKVLMSKIN